MATLVVKAFRFPTSDAAITTREEWGKPTVPSSLGVPPSLSSTPKTISASKTQIDTLQNVNWGGVISV